MSDRADIEVTITLRMAQGVDPSVPFTAMSGQPALLAGWDEVRALMLRESGAEAPQPMRRAA